MMVFNPLKPFDDSGERAARREFYVRDGSVSALIMVGAALCIATLVLGFAGSRWASATLFAWLVLTTLTAIREWRAGFRATAKNQLFMATLIGALSAPALAGLA